MKKKFKIAIILPTLISQNGPAKQAMELGKTLINLGHEVEFFTFAYSAVHCYPDFRKSKVNYCYKIENSLLFRFIKNVGTLEKIYLYLALVLLARFRKLLSQKKFDIYNPHDWLGLWVAARVKGAQIVALINDVPERDKNSLVERLKLAIDRASAKKIAYLLVLDEQNRREAIAWAKIEPQKVLVVRSGIDVQKYKTFRERYDLRRMFNLEPQSHVLICANLLLRHRRYEDVIYALVGLKASQPVHLIILAKQDFCPDYAAFLRQITNQLGLNDKVHFIDKFVSDEERMAYIAGSDLLIFPNSPQTWGLTAVEAMALGVPVVVSTGAGVSEVLHDGVDAIIYPQRNVAQLTRKLSFYLKNPEKLKRISQQGKAYVLATFSWEKFGGAVAHVIGESLRRPGEP